MATLTLLVTNDLHGHLGLAAVRQLGALKAAQSPCLLLDCGDAIARGNIAWHPRGEWIHERMNAAGYDAGALGNREYHFRPGPQHDKLKLATFPVLCANVRPVGWGGTIAGLRLQRPDWPALALFGLLVPMIPASKPRPWLSPSTFVDPLVAAREQVEASGSALTIVLSHLGAQRDRELAEACPQLGVIVGGHSHTPLRCEVGTTLISQGQPHGASVTRLRLSLEGTRLVRWEAEDIPLER